MSKVKYGANRVRPLRLSEVEQRDANEYALSVTRNALSYDRVESMGSEFYAGLDPRRKQERADAGMIREDHNAMANLSPVAIHHEWPRNGFWTSPYIDDSVREGE